MASAWNDTWGDSWGDAWGSVTPVVTTVSMVFNFSIQFEHVRSVDVNLSAIQSRTSEFVHIQETLWL